MEPERTPRRGSLTWWTSVSGVMTAIGTLIAAASLLVAAVAWLRPQSPAGGGPPAAAPSGAQSPRSPAASPRRPALFRTPWLALEFYRDDKRLPIYEQVRGGDDQNAMQVPIGGDPFEIRIPTVPAKVGMRICAWIDDSIYGAVRPGTRVPFSSPFGEGRGMGDSVAGDGRLAINNEEFNYFIDERLAHVSDRMDAVYVSDFSIGGSVRDELSGIEPTRTIYLTVYVDRDNDRVSDIGEYEFIELRR